MARYTRRGFNKGRRIKLGKGKYSDGREYHIDKNTGIDTTDVNDLFSLPPDGCLRRIYYRKTGMVRDTPEKQVIITKSHMLVISHLYMAQTGRKVQRTNKDYRSKISPHMIADFDVRIIGNAKSNTVPALVKIVTEQEYIRIKYGGLPELYRLQAQHASYVCNDKWAGVILYCPSRTKILSFDVPRDSQTDEHAVRACNDIWDMIQHQELPKAFDIKNRRCLFCSWRITCKGDQYLVEKLKESYSEMADDMLVLQTIEEEIRLARENVQDSIIKQLNGRKQLITPFATIDYDEKEQWKIDTAKMLKELPDLKTRYGKKIITKKVSITPWNLL